MRQYYNGVPISSGGGTDKKNITMKMYIQDGWTIKEYSNGFVEMYATLKTGTFSTLAGGMFGTASKQASKYWDLPLTLKSKVYENASVLSSYYSVTLSHNTLSSGYTNRTETHLFTFSSNAANPSCDVYVTVAGWLPDE